MNPFQWLVDESQKQPRWWCRQCAKVICVAVAALIFFTERPWSVGDSIANFLSMVWAALYLLISMSDLLCAHMACRPMRYWAWGWAELSCVHINSPSKAAECGACWAAAVFLEFTLCRPPAPPKHRGRRMASGSA